MREEDLVDICKEISRGIALRKKCDKSIRKLAAAIGVDMQEKVAKFSERLKDKIMTDIYSTGDIQKDTLDMIRAEQENVNNVRS